MSVKTNPPPLPPTHCLLAIALSPSSPSRLKSERAVYSWPHLPLTPWSTLAWLLGPQNQDQAMNISKFSSYLTSQEPLTLETTLSPKHSLPLALGHRVLLDLLYLSTPPSCLLCWFLFSQSSRVGEPASICTWLCCPLHFNLSVLSSWPHHAHGFITKRRKSFITFKLQPRPFFWTSCI